jgi:2-keto-3-deoxy-L-fuconate dehydrogenase
MFRLDGKTALVTGAGSGIGEAIARCFAGQGAVVWVVDRDQKSGAATVAAITSDGGKADFASADVSDAAAVLALAARLPPLDILVNNAGIGHVGNLQGTRPPTSTGCIRSTSGDPSTSARRSSPRCSGAAAEASISLASIGGVVAVRDRLAYTISKFAVVGLTKSLALDHSHEGVRFNCICPGRVETPFVKARIAEYPDPEKAYRDMASTQLNGRMARPEEIAAAALYLAADESEMVTGSSLMIDGGWSAGK